MPYDELGNFIPESLALDEMKYELAKKGNMPVRPGGSDVPYVISEIPQHYVAKPAPTPSTTATNIPQAIIDKLGISAIPQVAATMLTSFPAEVAKGLGFPEASKAIQYTPTSRGGKELLEAWENFHPLGSHMGAGPLPETWNMPAGLSAADVQVLGARGINAARELRAIPEDFRNAQSGLKRQNIYGDPTYGVRAQEVAEGIGDTLARREAMGKSTIPGIPDIIPETRMYAVRNVGEGQLLTPTDRPGINTRDITNYGQIARVNEAALGFNPQTFREQPIEQFNRYMDEFINPENVPSSLRKGWSTYFNERVQGLFPGADKQEALQGWSQLVSPADQTRYKNEFLQDFVAMPENKEVAKAAGLDLPSVDEYKARVEAAEKWLKGPFNKGYVQKFLGTKEDPILQQTEKGLSPIAVQQLLDEASQLTPNRLRALEQHRQQAGFNPKGEYLERVNNATLDLGLLKAQERELSTQQNAIARRLAETNPGEDPAALSPEFAKLSNQVTAKVNQIEKLEKQLENLKAAQAYETLSDYAILPHTAGEIKQDMTYVESQLFPGLAKTPDEAPIIELSRTGTQGSGIEEAAKNYVKDIISGKLPINQISNTSFEKHIGKQAGIRVQAEQAAKLAEKKKIEALNNYAKERVASQPDYLRFGNANVVEFNSKTPLEELRKGLSFETEMLDHCLGSGGSGAGRKHFITGDDRSHTPIIDPITGEVPKGSSGNDRGYVDHVRKGTTQIASVRDANTGYPAVTIELNKTSGGKFNLGYVSGYKNRVPEPEYRNATRDYLNSRADEIAGIGSNLERYGIYDQSQMTNQKLARIAGLSEHEVSPIQLAELPRFLTENDIRRAVRGEVVDIPPLPSRPSPEMLPAPTQEQMGAGAVGATRAYINWLNDRYPEVRDRLSQINEDIRDIQNGQITPGQYGLDADQFEQFTNELIRNRDEIRYQYRDQPLNAPAVNRLPAPRDVADRAITTQSQFRDREVQALTEAINNEIRALPTERQSLERYINTVNNNPLDLPGPIEQHLFNDESRNAISDYLIQQAQNRIENLPAARAEPQAIDRLIREEQANIDRAWEFLPQVYDYENMTPAQIRQQAAVLRRDPQQVLQGEANNYFLNPGFIEGLARQIEEQAAQQEILMREMNTETLNETLNDSLQAIRGIHGEGTFNDAIEIANEISNQVDLTESPERYISMLRQSSNVYPEGSAMRSALINLADDLEGAHLGDWENEEGLQLPVPEAAPQLPAGLQAPRGPEPTQYRDYYANPETGSAQAYDRIVRNLPDADIRNIINQTAGDAMYDEALMRQFQVQSPAGIRQLNNALRRYMEGRDLEHEARMAEITAPARPADNLPAVRDIPMGQNFLSDSIDALLNNDHVDTFMEIYREIAEEVEDLSDRGNQRQILRRIRDYAEHYNDIGDTEAAAAIDHLADIMRMAIIEASERPAGHKKGGYISKKPVYFANDTDAMRYELTRNR